MKIVVLYELFYFILALFYALMCFSWVHDFLQIYISVIVQGSKCRMSMYVHVTVYIVLSSINSFMWWPLHTWTSLMSSRPCVTVSSPYCSSLAFPSRSMTHGTWKDMESKAVNSTWRLVDTQPSIYEVEGASMRVISDLERRHATCKIASAFIQWTCEFTWYWYLYTVNIRSSLYVLHAPTCVRDPPSSPNWVVTISSTVHCLNNVHNLLGQEYQSKHA